MEVKYTEDIWLAGFTQLDPSLVAQHGDGMDFYMFPTSKAHFMITMNTPHNFLPTVPLRLFLMIVTN